MKEEKKEVSIDLAGASFRLVIGKTIEENLGLLSAVVETPAQSQKLARLLRQLRARVPFEAISADGDFLSHPADLKRLWLEALRTAELSAAESLRQRLAKPGGTDRYLGR